MVMASNAAAKSLGDQATQLESSLGSYNKLCSEAVGVLNALDKRLQKMAKLTAPIYQRASVLTWAEEKIEQTKTATDELLMHLEAPQKVEAAMKHGPQRDLETFLKHLTTLQAALDYLDQHSQLQAAQQAVAHANRVHARAMADCEADFASTLTQASSAIMPSASLLVKQASEHLAESAENPALTMIPAGPLGRLQRLAGVMHQARHMSCLDAYLQVRSKAVEQMMRLVGFEPAASTAMLQTQSQEQLERTMQSWTTQLRVLVVVACSELHIAKSIWEPPTDEAMFSDTISRVLKLLVQQGRDISEARRQPHKVFVLLEMSKHLEEVLPLLEGLLGGKERCGQFLSDLRSLNVVMAKAARSIFSDFEQSIGRDASKVQTVDGTVHPLCAQTLGYLRRLFSYPNVVNVLFSAHSVGGGGGPGSGEALTAMSSAVEGVLESLLHNLQAKSKVYKSPALAALFLMNNVQYMVKTFEAAEQLAVLGREWVEAHHHVVEQYGDQYHELSWGPIIKGLQRVESGEDPEPRDPTKWHTWVKSKFKSFNSALEALYAMQTGWSIPDTKLKAAVRQVVLQDLLPLYERFYTRFQGQDFTTNRSKYLRYSPGDVEVMVDTDFFEGRQMTLTQVSKRQLATTSSAPSAPSVSGSSTSKWSWSGKG
mmetsp:Transcript_32957/g.72844  ORF Transcript_32957/g.72844 Transcript_32957/m.72844 type:complete len:654 (-) Transcript_32957:625-2586(-)